MKKVFLLALAVLGTVTLQAQDRDQVKLKLKDGSCLVADGSQLQDGTCLLQDGTCLDINNISGTTSDKDQIRLRDDSCIVEDGILNNFKKFFGKFKR